MKKIIIGAAFAIGLAAPAVAADLPARPARAPVVAVPVVYNWSGFYIGIHGGGIWGDKDWEVTRAAGALPIGVLEATFSHDLRGWLAGGQMGFNIQSGQWVFGAEAQWSWTDADGHFDCGAAPDARCGTELNWVGTVAGRLGIAVDRALFYVKGGVAFVDEDYNVSGASFSLSDGHRRTGWMVGAGLEFALASNWSVKVEYNYMDFGSKSVTVGTADAGITADVDQVLHVVKFGVNYRFGGPVVARY